MTVDNLQVRFGRRCRVLRRRRKLSQMDMVRWHGWDLAHYQRIERGVLDIKLSTLEKLSECFDVTLATLMRGL